MYKYPFLHFFLWMVSKSLVVSSVLHSSLKTPQAARLRSKNFSIMLSFVAEEKNGNFET